MRPLFSGMSIETFPPDLFRTYRAWTALRHRCQGMNNKDRKNYGDRGITFDPRWSSFHVFLKDVGLSPGKLYTIERKNNNKGYYPRNVIWATRTVQHRNRRCTKLTLQKAKEIRHATGTQRDIGTRYGVCQQLVSRIKHGKAWV